MEFLTFNIMTHIINIFQMILTRLSILALIIVGIYCKIAQKDQFYQQQIIENDLKQRPQTEDKYWYNQQDSDLSPQDLQYSNYISHFSREHFRATQSFSFFLSGKQSYKFDIFPNMSNILIGGRYNYSYQLGEDDYGCQNGCVFLNIYKEGFVIRRYGRSPSNRFFFSHEEKECKYTFQFNNEGNQTRRINITYQYSSVYSTTSTKKLLNISKVTSLFENVNRIVKFQELKTRNILKIQNIEQEKLSDRFYHNVWIWQIIFQTVMILLGNFLSLYALKKHLCNDYYPLH